MDPKVQESPLALFRLTVITDNSLVTKDQNKPYYILKADCTEMTWAENVSHEPTCTQRQGKPKTAA